MSFTYGNRNQITTMLQGANLTTYTYSNNANLGIEQTGAAYTTYTYDQSNRMTGVLYSDATRSTYTYRGDGKRRSAQEPGGSLNTMIWDGEDYLGEY